VEGKTKKTIKPTVIVLLLTCFIAALAVYDVRINADGYNILLKNRLTGLGFGILHPGIYNKNGFEIWSFAHTVHGGLAEKPLWPSIDSQN
jgi:hypothetical protein